MKSIMAASAIVMSLVVPALAQGTRPTDPQHSPLAQNTPAQRDPGKQSPLSAAAADTTAKAGSGQIMNSVPAQAGVGDSKSPIRFDVMSIALTKPSGDLVFQAAPV